VSAAERLPDRPKGYDVSDALDDGTTYQDLIRLVEATPVWPPPHPVPAGPPDLDPNSPVPIIPLRIATISAVDLVRRQFPEPRWAVSQVVPEGASLLVGAPKKGKSWFLLGLGIAVAAGGKALGKIDVEAGDVLLLCLEDTQRRLQERLWRILGDESAPSRLYLATEWPRLDQGAAEQLDLWLRDHPGTRLVGVDVIARLRPPTNGNGNLYHLDYGILAELKAVADAHRVALVAVHHSRKAGAEDPLDTISGTSGLAAAADTALILTREPGRADANLYLRGRDVPEADHALSFEPSTCTWHLLGDAAEYRMTSGRADVVSLLRAGGPLTPKEIATALGMEPGNARVLLHRMKQAEQVVSVGGAYHVSPCNTCNGVTPAAKAAEIRAVSSPLSVTPPPDTCNAELSHEQAETGVIVTPVTPLQPPPGREVFDL